MDFSQSPQTGAPATVGQPPAPGQQPRRSWVSAAALITSFAALAVGGAALVQGRTHNDGLAPAAHVSSAAGHEDADRALCGAIAPLMGEDDTRSNNFIDSGPSGSPERDTGLPRFRSETEDWAARIQTVVDAHPDADPFFRRTLQRFIDDRRLLVANMRPGPAKRYDEEIWSDSLAAYGGPLLVCQRLGIEWA